MQLHFRSYGSGPPLVILHGLFGSLDNWATLARRMGEGFTVFTPDARNHGRSPHDDRIDYEVMAEDVRDFLLQQEITSAGLIGHSMGGKTAMQCSLLFPDIVDRLMVVDMLPIRYPPGHDHILEALRAVPIHELKNRTEAEETMQQYIAEPAVRQFLMKNIHRTTDGKFAWKMNLTAIERNYDRINGALRAGDAPFRKPTLFLRGGKSPYIADLLPDEVKKSFPLATLHTIEKAGHWVHADAPGEFYAEAVQFFQSPPRERSMI